MHGDDCYESHPLFITPRWLSRDIRRNFHDKLFSRILSACFLWRIKLRLHAAICRARFVFWRMQFTANATIPLHSDYGEI
jgi:hypothetical protein